MSERPIEYYLKKLEDYRREDLEIFRSSMSSELGIPFETYRNWYRRSEKRSSPSSKYAKCIKSFLESREVISAKRWIEEDGPDLLNRIGVKKGQTVMDFGSGNGDYTLVLARTVGEKGKVYAVDKDKEVLDKLIKRASGKGFENIEGKFVYEETKTPTKIPLPDKSIDAAWFSDVLHDGYFKDEQKEELLFDVYRILKEDAFIAVHPVHMEKERLKRVIESTGFCLEEECHEVVIFHGSEFHEGRIFKYKKDREYYTCPSTGSLASPAI